MICGLCDRPLDSGTVCQACMGRARSTLEAIPALAEELTITIARQGRQGSSNGRGGSGSPSPINLGALEAGDNLHGTLASWTWIVARAKGILRPAFSTMTQRRRYSAAFPQRDAIEAMAVFLGRHLEFLRQHAIGAQFVTQVIRDTERAQAEVDIPSARWYAGPCDTCSASLYAASLGSVVACRRCGATYDVTARRAWLLEAVRDELATTTEICRALTTLMSPVTGAMIRGFVHRGRLEVREHDDRGNPRYRVGDVIELIEARKKATA